MRLSLLLTALLLAVSCTSTTEQTTVTFGANGNDSGAQPRSGKQLDERFAGSFADGRVIKTPEHQGVLNVRSAGTLKIASGLLVASDPFIAPQTAPFAQTIPRGEYPVVLSLLKTSNDERVAFAKLQVGTNPSVSWKIAELKEDLSGEHSFYHVDTGTGSFMDSRTAMVVDEKLGAEIEQGHSSFSDEVIRAMEENRRAGKGEWANIFIPEADANLIIFGSGWGDGTYRTYLGLDADGNVAEFVTDFEIVP